MGPHSQSTRSCIVRPFQTTLGPDLLYVPKIQIDWFYLGIKEPYEII